LTVAERLAAQRPFWRPGTSSGYHALVMAALSGEVVRRATGASVQELFAELLRDPLGLDLYLGLPADQEHRFLPAQPMIDTPERLAGLAATTAAPDSISGVAFNRHAPGNREVWELPNLTAVRSKGTASFGGVGTARGLAKLYSALVSPVDRNQPLLSTDTASAFAQIQSNTFDLVLRCRKAWAVGFHSYSEIYPSLAAWSFGHSGAGGQQALVDPRNELSYAFLRRRFLFPAQADPDHDRLLRALRTAVVARRS
jgi:CubicO group peptidase (beta-lactamase class C family)